MMEQTIKEKLQASIVPLIMGNPRAADLIKIINSINIELSVSYPKDSGDYHCAVWIEPKEPDSYSTLVSRLVELHAIYHSRMYKDAKVKASVIHAGETVHYCYVNGQIFDMKIVEDKNDQS